MHIKKQSFGKTPQGEDVELFTLTNIQGLEAAITNYGGIVTRLLTPDRNGNFADIVLGYETLEEYIRGNPYFGALIGRYANRIAGGRFRLEGVEYSLATNNGPNHLHGGIRGFDKVVWQTEAMETDSGPSLRLKYRSADGEEGYPGSLDCDVLYQLTNENELKISYKARTDRTTIVNLTHHSYFNLGGHDSGDILGHELELNASQFTPVNDALIPTGRIEPVKATPMDFTTPRLIGERIEQVKGGYDHNYVLENSDGSLAPAGSVYEPQDGRKMRVLTTEPGMQFYSGNFLDGSNKGKGAVYNKHNGFCLEAQHFPDSPNRPEFPSVALRPGQVYRQLTVYKFSAQ